MLLERLRYDDPESGNLSFSASGAIITALYPSLLDLQQRYPSLKVNVEAAPNRRIIESISNGTIDSGMVTASIQNPELSAEYIGQLELCLIGSRDAVAKFSASEAINQLGVVDHPDAQYYLQKYIEDSDSKSSSRQSGKILIKSPTLTSIVRYYSLSLWALVSLYYLKLR